MNCANHPANQAVAYCRTCGKPLCATCKRDVMGVIYCEQCLAERLKDVQPSVPLPVGGFVPAQLVTNMGMGGPHPAVAGILAGFFPFGVGAVYTGQYAKGLAHLLIFVGLIWGLSSGHMGGLEPVLGIGMGFFCVYQIIDAVRSAHAIRMGQAPPDPFGFNRTFGMVDRYAVPGATYTSSVPSASSASDPVPLAPAPRVPTAAVVLIGLGALFLLQTAGVFEFNVGRIWPLFLIGLGIWLFVSRSGMLGPESFRHSRTPQGDLASQIPGRRMALWSGPIWLITIGVLFLLQSVDERMNFGHTWPVLLLVVGVMKLMKNRAVELPPAGGYPAYGSAPIEPNPIQSNPIGSSSSQASENNPSASNEVKNG